MKTKYDELKTQYPSVISINQFYKICHVAKRSAVKLLENGDVPYTDTGKKTWKYQIKLDDAIAYLKKRDCKISKVSRSTDSSPHRQKSVRDPAIPKSFSQSIKGKKPDLIKQFFAQKDPNCPDMLAAAQIAEITGMGVNIVRQKIRMGQLNAVSNWNMYYVPKDRFYKFLTTPGFYSTVCFGEKFGENLTAFEAWLKNNEK